MSKIAKKQQLLQELLQLENEDLGDVGEPKVPPTTPSLKSPLQDESESDEEKPITRPKKKLTDKQLEALKKGQEKRNENRERNRLIKEQQEEEERKVIEAKLVKKAIAIKKKQIKKQAVIDEISDDETGKPTVSPVPPSLPLQKEKAQKTEVKVNVVPLIRFV
jgi:hypothetical protein